MNYINQIIYSAENVFSYYKSYYITNAWLELLTVQAKNRWIWFENNIWTGSDIFTQNFLCENCDFEASIVGRTKTISKEFWKWTWCISPIDLSQWESVLIPLFADSFSGSFLDSLNEDSMDKWDNLSDTLESLNLEINEWLWQEVNIWILIMSWWDLRENGLFSRTRKIKPDLILEFLDLWIKNAEWIQPLVTSSQTLDNLYKTKEYPFRNYLIIANNTLDKETSFCINSPTPIATDNFFIRSNGRYNDQTLWLELLYKQPIPWFLLNSFGN